MAIQIITADSVLHTHAIFQLRYQIYVEELGRTQQYADHEQRMIREPLDETARLFVALDGPKVVGSVRTNYSRSSALGEYATLYGMDVAHGAHPAHTSITTKLLVAAPYRSTALAYRLAVATYRTALRDGILFDFIDVYPERAPFFERLGYRIHIPEVVHSEYGKVIVMKLAVRDSDHLRRVGSPFLRYLNQQLAAA
jgi:hypothetical protein